MIGNRRLLLADEPTGALDTVNGDQVVELLADLARTVSVVAVVMVTHDPRFASWADRVVFIRDGRIVDETRGCSPQPSAIRCRSRSRSRSEVLPTVNPRGPHGCQAI